MAGNRRNHDTSQGQGPRKMAQSGPISSKARARGNLGTIVPKSRLVSSPGPLILSDVAGAIHRHSDNPRHPSPLWISEAFGTDPIPDYHREA